MTIPVERRAIQVLPEEFANKPPEGLGSEAVYRRLTDEGMHVPDYALSDLWEKLDTLEYIAGRRVLGVDETTERQHGGWYIQRVHPDILDALDEPEL